MPADVRPDPDHARRGGLRGLDGRGPRARLPRAGRVPPEPRDPRLPRRAERLRSFGAQVTDEAVERADRGEGAEAAADVLAAVLGIEGVRGVHLIGSSAGGAPSGAGGGGARRRRLGPGGRRRTDVRRCPATTDMRHDRATTRGDRVTPRPRKPDAAVTDPRGSGGVTSLPAQFAALASVSRPPARGSRTASRSPRARARWRCSPRRTWPRPASRRRAPRRSRRRCRTSSGGVRRPAEQRPVGAGVPWYGMPNAAAFTYRRSPTRRSTCMCVWPPITVGAGAPASSAASRSSDVR